MKSRCRLLVWWCDRWNKQQRILLLSLFWNAPFRVFNRKNGSVFFSFLFFFFWKCERPFTPQYSEYVRTTQSYCTRELMLAMKIGIMRVYYSYEHIIRCNQDPCTTSTIDFLIDRTEYQIRVPIPLPVCVGVYEESPRKFMHVFPVFSYRRARRSNCEEYTAHGRWWGWLEHQPSN